MTDTEQKAVPFLAEIIDAYLTLHLDYLRTDSITEAEKLTGLLDAIEKDMKDRGCQIEFSTDKWREYICGLPELKHYDQVVPGVLKEAGSKLEGPNAILLLQCLRTLEDEVLRRSGRKLCEKEFYTGTDIFEIINGTTLRKHVMFGDRSIITSVATKSEIKT